MSSELSDAIKDFSEPVKNGLIQNSGRLKTFQTASVLD